MNDAREWLTRHRARLSRWPALEDALLDAAPARYAVHRLRYVLARALLRTGFRLLELALFASVLSFELLGPILLLRSGLLVFDGLWWGGLETLRRDVRAQFAAGESPIRVVRQWLALGSLIAAFSVLASLAWVLWGPSRFVGFDVLDAFVLGCAVRLAMDVLVRTYHSGVYGVRRVYRPAWSLLSIDLADVLLLLIAYLWLGAWGLGVSIATVGLLRAWLSRRFIGKTYAQLRLEVGRLSSWFRSLRRATWSPKHTLASALGNAVAQLDALFVLGLLAAPANTDGALLLAALFHGIGPLQTAAFTWSRLFYFDFKRLEAWGSPLLLARFEAFMRRVAFWVPLPVGLCTLSLLALFWRGPFWLLSLELTALAAVRARLSLLHVRAFSLSDHAFLRRLFVGMSLIVLVTPLLGTLPADVSVGALALITGLSSWLLGRSERVSERSTRTAVLGVAAWLRRLLEREDTVRLGVLCVDRRLTSLGKLLRALGPALPGASLARLAKDTFVWFAPVADANADADAVATARLVELAAGTLREHHLGEPAVGGRAALLRGVSCGPWQRHLGRHLARSANGIDLEWLRTALSQVAPGSRCVELTGDVGPALSARVTPRELCRLILDAARGRSGFTRLGATEAAVLAPSGQPLALVLVPPGPQNTATWRADAADLVRLAEVTMTLAAGGSSGERPENRRTW